MKSGERLEYSKHSKEGEFFALAGDKLGMIYPYRRPYICVDGFRLTLPQMA